MCTIIRILLLLLLMFTLHVSAAGQGLVTPQSTCKIRCENGGMCVFDLDHPNHHSCICLLGVYTGDRCQYKVTDEVTTTTVPKTTTTTTTTPTPRGSDEERRREYERRLEMQRAAGDNERAQEEKRRREEHERYWREENERKAQAHRETERRRLEKEYAERARETERRRQQEEEERDREMERREREEVERRRQEEERMRDLEKHRKREEAERRRQEEQDRAASTANQQWDYKAGTEDDYLVAEKDEYDEGEVVEKDEGEQEEEFQQQQRQMEKQERMREIYSEEDTSPPVPIIGTVTEVTTGVAVFPIKEEEEAEEETTETPEQVKGYENTLNVVSKAFEKAADDTIKQHESDIDDVNDYWDHTPERTEDDVKRDNEESKLGTHEDDVKDFDIEKNSDGWMMVKKAENRDDINSSAKTLSTIILSTVLLPFFFLF